MKYNIDYNNLGRFWIKDENKILKKYFPILPIEKIMEMLPHRTKTAIMGQAYNVLKLHSPCISKHFKGNYFENPYKSFSLADRAYIAGIIDGEGCIDILFKKFHARLAIINTNFELINWLIKKIPNFSIHIPKLYKKTHKKRWVIRLSSLHTYHLLKLICPFLIVKKQKAELIIKLFDNLAKGISWREQIKRGILKISK